MNHRKSLALVIDDIGFNPMVITRYASNAEILDLRLLAIGVKIANDR